MIKLENVVCAGNWTWPSSSRRWYGTECNLGVTSLAFLRHLDYFCFLCSTDLFNKYLLMVFFVQRTVWECEEKCGVLHFVVYVGKRTWVRATSGVCAMVNAIKVARTSCWWSKRKSSLFGGFRPWLTLFFYPGAFLTLEPLFVNPHQFWGEKGLIFVSVILRSTVSKRKSVILAPRKQGAYRSCGSSTPVCSRITTLLFWAPVCLFVCFYLCCCWWNLLFFLLHKEAHVGDIRDERLHISVIFTLLLVFEMLMVNDFESILGI